MENADSLVTPSADGMKEEDAAQREAAAEAAEAAGAVNSGSTITVVTLKYSQSERARRRPCIRSETQAN